MQFKDKNKEVIMMILLFSIYFIVDTIFFVKPTAPFLRSRQMYSFVFGVLIHKYYNNFILYFKNIKYITINIIIGILMMIITQTMKTTQIIITTKHQIILKTKIKLITQIIQQMKVLIKNTK